MVAPTTGGMAMTELIIDADAHLTEPAGELSERPGNDEDERHQGTTTAFTEMTGGSPSCSSDQLSPSSLEANSFPLRVPK